MFHKILKIPFSFRGIPSQHFLNFLEEQEAIMPIILLEMIMKISQNVIKKKNIRKSEKERKEGKDQQHHHYPQNILMTGQILRKKKKGNDENIKGVERGIFKLFLGII